MTAELFRCAAGNQRSVWEEQSVCKPDLGQLEVEMSLPSVETPELELLVVYCYLAVTHRSKLDRVAQNRL